MSWNSLGEVFSVVRRMHGQEAAESVVRDLRPQLELDLPDARRVLEAATIKADLAFRTSGRAFSGIYVSGL